MVKRSDFEWDSAKDQLNQKKHGVSFALGESPVEFMTVRFTYRKNKIRIIGAGYWRKGKRIYEKENKIHG